jgi:hypothetical protein
MSGGKFYLVVILIIAACNMASAQSTQSDDEADLIAFLTKEYKPGALKFGNYGRAADGNFVWGATFHRELRVPMIKLSTFCSSKSGTLKLLLPAAGIFPNVAADTAITINDQSFTIDQADLFEWSGKVRGDSVQPALHGFEYVFDQRLIAGRTKVVSEANANPPLGLFGCIGEDRNLKWATSVMAGHYGGNGWLYLKILPVTYNFLADKREAAKVIKQREAASRQKQIEDVQKAEAFAAAEQQRLGPWQKGLRIGDQTNCGLIINDRGAVVEVQMPSGFVGPAAERQFWIKRMDLADYPFPTGCNYGR